MTVFFTAVLVLVIGGVTVIPAVVGTVVAFRRGNMMGGQS